MHQTPLSASQFPVRELSKLTLVSECEGLKGTTNSFEVLVSVCSEDFEEAEACWRKRTFQPGATAVSCS